MKRSLNNWSTIVLGVMLPLCALGQTPVAATASPDLPGFRQEQLALLKERQQLIAQGATSAQVEAWQQANEAQFSLLRQQAQALSDAALVLPKPIIKDVKIPAGASPAFKDFLTGQVALANARAQIHNQLIQSLPANPTDGQIAQRERRENQLFLQQHIADLKLQQQKGQALAQASSSLPGISGPPPLRIPANASPQLAAFLTTRQQVMLGQADVQKQYAKADAATMRAAMAQWRQQNAALFQQMQQQAQALASSTPQK